MLARLVMIALAACSTPPGIARITIDLPATMAPIQSVSLFVGTGSASAAGIGPEGHPYELSGITSWSHDDTAPFVVDAVTSDHVVFELQRGPGGDDIAIAIAVADDAQGN